jgi:hypothetical protein
MTYEELNRLETKLKSLSGEELRTWLKSLSTKELTTFIQYRIGVDIDKKLPGIIKRFKAAWGIA